jgi:hypothetical protein
MKNYKFQAKFIEMNKKGKIVNGFIVPMEIPSNDYETAVIGALHKAQETLRTLDGHYFFRLEVIEK